MGFHIWDGLATLPYAGHTHAPPDTHFAEEQYMFHPTMAPTDVAALVNTQFGDRSPWSQVQVRPKDHPYRLLGGAVGVRVDTAPPGVSEASAKNGGITPVQQAQQLSKIKKRSLRRAIKRAQQQGHTVYRGRRLVAHPDLLRHTSEPKSPPASTRLECITWNVGGLTQVLMAELMVWLRHQPHIRAIMLQETHWSASCDWAADGWNFCHSASSRPRSGGVLVGLRQDTFARELIRWQEIVPGRLLHVRAFAFQQHVDLITVYQHALPFSGELLEEVMKRRNGLLKALDKHIGALPARSSVVIGGDLNSVLAPSPPNVGHGVHQGLDRPHLVEERKWLGDMLRRHGLCVLNSWRQKRYTYKHPNGKSQIDYLIVRKILADNQARNASAIDVPLAGWRTSGHFPVRASLKWDWRPWRHAAHQRTQQRTAPLVDASYQHPELTRLKQHLHQESTAASAPHKPQAPDITGPIKTYWQARARFKAAEAGSLRGIFERFRLHTTMTRAHRELRRAARARKVQQQQTILQLAEDHLEMTASTLARVSQQALIDVPQYAYRPQAGVPPHLAIAVMQALSSLGFFAWKRLVASTGRQDAEEILQTEAAAQASSVAQRALHRCTQASTIYRARHLSEGLTSSTFARPRSITTPSEEASGHSDGNCSWVKEKIAEGHSSSELLLLVQSLEQVRQMLDSPVTTLQTQDQDSLATTTCDSPASSVEARPRNLPPINTNDVISRLDPPLDRQQDVLGLSGPPPDWILNLKLDNPGLRALHRRSSSATTGCGRVHRACAPGRQLATWLVGGHAPICLPVSNGAFDLQDAVQVHGRGQKQCGGHSGATALWQISSHGSLPSGCKKALHCLRDHE